MSTEIIRVPDIGGAADVDVIEISVQVGDMVEVDQPIVVLETDKASMDVPSPLAGKVISIAIEEGGQVSEGSAILELEVMTATSSVVANTVQDVPVVASAAPASDEPVTNDSGRCG